MSHFILGVAAQKQGRCEDALAAFGRAEDALRLRKQAILRNLHASRADCLARMGREAEAEKEFLAEIETIPSLAGGPRRPGHALPLAGPRRGGARRARRA